MSERIFLTGGTGFIGGHVARKLIERGDDVAAGPQPREGRGPEEDRLPDLAGRSVRRRRDRKGIDGAEAAIHGAAIYEVGIPESEREQMVANVEGTGNVLAAALRGEDAEGRLHLDRRRHSATPRSGRRRDLPAPRQGFTSYYEQTKYVAHQEAKELISDGPALRDRPAGRRLRAGGPLRPRQADPRLPRRPAAAIPFADLG